MSLDLLTNYFPISSEECKECFGKPCACLACRHEDYFCIDDPCYVCSGEIKDITTTFCCPTNEELGPESSQSI